MAFRWRYIEIGIFGLWMNQIHESMSGSNSAMFFNLKKNPIIRILCEVDYIAPWLVPSFHLKFRIFSWKWWDSCRLKYLPGISFFHLGPGHKKVFLALDNDGSASRSLTMKLHCHLEIAWRKNWPICLLALAQNYITPGPRQHCEIAVHCPVPFVHGAWHCMSVQKRWEASPWWHNPAEVVVVDAFEDPSAPGISDGQGQTCQGAR